MYLQNNKIIRIINILNNNKINSNKSKSKSMENYNIVSTNKHLMKKVDVRLDDVRRVIRLMHPRPIVLLTCSDKEGKENAITVAWSTPTSFEPPMVAVSVSPKNYSHSLISETKEFVVNVPPIDLLDESYFIGSYSGKELDKFKEIKLTKKPAKKVKAPIIEECFAHLECKVEKEVNTGDHTLFIGLVLTAYSSEGAFTNEGVIDIKKFKPIMHCGGNIFTTISDKIFKPKELKI